MYARKETQSDKVSYKDEEKGYTCDIYSFNWYLAVITVIVTTAAICISWKVLDYLLNSKSERAELNRAMFFSLGFVASFVNIVDVAIIVYEIYIYIDGIQEETDHDIRKISLTDSTLAWHGIFKILEISVGLFVFVIGGAITTHCLKQPQLCNTNHSRSSSAENCCSCCSKFAYFLYFANFFYFAYMVGLNVLPTFLMLLITPIETISVLVFYVSLLSSAVMLVTIITVQIKIHTLNESDETGSNGTGSKGIESGKTESDETGSNGTGSNGTGSKGIESGKTESDETGSNGTGSNGTGSNGTGSNETESDGTANTKDKKKLYREILTGFVYFLALISIVLLVVVFLLTLASTTNDNASNLATVILSFGSATFSILGAYFTKKILSKKNTKNSNVKSGKFN